jgi:hypothetical protein
MEFAATREDEFDGQVQPQRDAVRDVSPERTGEGDGAGAGGGRKLAAPATTKVLI